MVIFLIMSMSTKQPLVSIIIVNFNGKGYLMKCLRSLKKQSYENIEVIVVDNASIDGSVEVIRKIKIPHSRLQIIVNKENLGFAEANNIGYQRTKGELVLFLNNDTEVTRDFLKNLVQRILKDKKIGGVQSKIFLMDKRDTLDSVGSFLTMTGIMYHYGVFKKDSVKYSKYIAIHTAKGACMLFRRNVLEKVMVRGEIFDGRYFAYFEESDLCHRVWLAGYEIYFVPDSVIYHKMGATSSKLANPFVQFHSYKNRINSYLKNLEVKNLVRILVPHLFLCEVMSGYYLVRGSLGMALAIQKAMLWNILNISQTLSKRKIVQDRVRRVSDEEIFARVMKKVGLGYYINLFSGLTNYED